MSRASNAARALPEHGDGESDGGGRWVLLCRVPSPVEASLLEGLLEENGIRVVVENVYFTQEPTSFGALGNFRVHVLEDDLERARKLLEQTEEQDGRPPLELV